MEQDSPERCDQPAPGAQPTRPASPERDRPDQRDGAALGGMRADGEPRPFPVPGSGQIEPDVDLDMNDLPGPDDAPLAPEEARRQKEALRSADA